MHICIYCKVKKRASLSSHILTNSFYFKYGWICIVIFCYFNIKKKMNHGWHGGTVVSTVTSQQDGRRFDSQTRGLCLLRLQVLPVSVLSRCCSFLPHSKEMNITGSSKLSVDASVSASACLSLCGLMINWVTQRLSPSPAIGSLLKFICATFNGFYVLWLHTHSVSSCGLWLHQQ